MIETFKVPVCDNIFTFKVALNVIIVLCGILYLYLVDYFTYNNIVTFLGQYALIKSIFNMSDAASSYLWRYFMFKELEYTVEVDTDDATIKYIMPKRARELMYSRLPSIKKCVKSQSV
jgi:hypothetical protein